jgi:hypothetical protein
MEAGVAFLSPTRDMTWIRSNSEDKRAKRYDFGMAVGNFTFSCVFTAIEAGLDVLWDLHYRNLQICVSEFSFGWHSVSVTQKLVPKV